MKINIAKYFNGVDQSSWQSAAMKSLKLNSTEELERYLETTSLEGVSFSADQVNTEKSHELSTFPESRLLARYSSSLNSSDSESGVNFCISENQTTEAGIFLLTDIKVAELPGEINLDLVATLDQFDYDLKKYKLWATQLSKKTKVFPYLRISNIHNAGSSSVQEIALMISLLEFAKRDCGLENTFFVEFATDSLYFSNIAKLRASRFILESLCEQWESFDFEILASTSLREQTLYDPWVNMLRATSASSSAFLGGANTLILRGYDSAMKQISNKFKESELSLRQSRNIFHILKEESHLTQVKDPSFGSYAIENLTYEYITTSFELFKNYEKRGGLLNCITQFCLEVEKTALERCKAVNNGNLSLVGINDFSNTSESFKENFKLELEPDELYASQQSIYFPLRRTSEDFEKLRLKASKLDLSIQLCVYGDEAKLTGRMMFCSNYFEVLGKKVEVQILSDLSGLKNVDGDIVILCALDSDYDAVAASEISAKKKYLAGAKVKAEGFENIFQGQDKFNVLNDLVQEFSL